MNRLPWFTLLVLLLLPLAASAADKVVVYNWSEYIPDAVLEQFTEETGIDVVYSTYESNEVMYSKLQLQNSQGYDVVFPSTYYVAKMAREGMLQPLDQSRLSGLKNLDPNLLNMEYGVPGDIDVADLDDIDSPSEIVYAIVEWVPVEQVMMTYG